MRVKVVALFSLKEVLGSSELEISIHDNSTLFDLLSLMSTRYGESFSTTVFRSCSTNELNRHVRIVVNGQDIAFLKGLKTTLKEGDVIIIFPPASGG